MLVIPRSEATWESASLSSKKVRTEKSVRKTGLWDKDMSRDRLAAGQLDKLWLEDNTFI